MEFEGYGVKWTDTRKSITYTTPNGMKCRDDRLHESKYIKERMELELRIRQEIVAGRTQTAEQTTATPRADAHSFSSGTGEIGQSVLQSERHLGWDRGFAESAESLATAEPQSRNPDEQPTEQGGFRETGQEIVGVEQDTITGWEQERESFFSTQAEATQHKLDNLPLDINQLASLSIDIISLGRSMESLDQSAPVIDSTTQIVVHERKRGHGHKKDDHESQEYKMTM